VNVGAAQAAPQPNDQGVEASALNPFFLFSFEVSRRHE
jgi:hypothetical protein